MQAYLATRISPNISRTPEGFLIATASIARSGWQAYRRDELDSSTNDQTIVRVFRPVAEVTSARTMASGEGKPIVSPHPATGFVRPDNWSWTAKGHIQNVRVGPMDKNGNATLMADLHIHDASLISKIAAGTRDLSCGYSYDLVTLADGNYAMRNIKLNHVAVVEQGRAGTTQIMDAKGTCMTKDERDTVLARIADGIEKLLSMQDAEPEEELELEEPEEEEGEEETADARALAGLRKLRPAIAASGNRDAMDAYNTTVRKIKERMRNNATIVDNAVRRSLGADNVDFFAAARHTTASL